MSIPFESLAIAVASFGATNLDDLFVLMLFFGQAQAENRPYWPVVLGQYLGFSLLLGVSMVGCLAPAFLTPEGIGLLGLLPIAVALREFRRLRRTPNPETAVGLAASWGESVTAVTVVTVANGADNIAVYIPLFAASSSSRLTIIGLVFMVLLAVWCLLGQWLGSRPSVAARLRRRGRRIVPWVLIAIGIHVLIEGRVWQLLRVPHLAQ
jgi:cadmium resistance protein CadD (predicted permease)